MDEPGLIFLKLGGSLITDKDRPHTPRLEILARLADEIAAARQSQPTMRLLIGHGSGSFGHVAARKYGTRQGVHSPQDWLGFSEVWKEARALNQMVLEALLKTGLPVVAFPPSASVIARDGRPFSWDLAPLRAALQAGLIPLVNGDTIFDELRGGTILSTEDLFIFLARALRPRRILLAGLEAGVWADFPDCTHLIDIITPAKLAESVAKISGSSSVDVTGGMLEKVQIMLRLAAELPGFEALIFSGLQQETVRDALLGASPGTMLRNDLPG